MDVSLHKAATEGNVELLTNILEADNALDLTLCLTPKENTALHIAVAFGHEQIVRQMIDRQPALICQQNSDGENPLHIAAKAGNLSPTMLLTLLPREGVQRREYGAAALQMKNLDGYTPIHEALKKRYHQVAIPFLRFDQPIEEADDVSNAGESLLYLSCEAGLFYAATVIIDTGNFSHRGPHGQNPLHIAVITGNLGMVQVLMERAYHFIEESDDFGRTALHYASIIGNHDDLGRRKTILENLIRAERSLAYRPDHDGNYPLLIATIKSSFEAVETILYYCPDSAELVDQSGRNALHLAVLNNNVDILGSLIERREFKMLINKGDEHGNTLMHLAIEHNYEEIMERLLRCEGLDLAATNNEGHTAMDICGYMPQQLLIHHKLKTGGAFPSRLRWGEMLVMPRLPLPPPPPPPPQPESGLFSSSSNMEAITNTLLIVTTLVATVTFAAGFTVPGGYKNDGVREGLPVFIKNAAFITFLISDTLAFCSSMAATILLIFVSANPTNKFLSGPALQTCACISAVAIPATLAAFITGIYVLTSKENLGLAVTSVLLGCVVPVFVLWGVWDMKRRAKAKNQ